MGVEKSVTLREMSKLSGNTVALVLRTLVSVVIGLVTSRLVLSALGVDDYGLYAVLTSLVSMLDFVNLSMSGATTRYLSYELGKGKAGNPGGILRSSFRLSILLAVVLLLLAESAGLWYVSDAVSSGGESAGTVMFVYQMIVLGGIIGVVRTPAAAWLLSRERMTDYARIEIGSALMRLAAVVSLFYGIFGNGIKVYAVLILAVSTATTLIYLLAIRNDMREYGGESGRSQIKSIVGYSLVDMFGYVAVLFHSQGIMLVMNLVYGLAANAALALAKAVELGTSGLVSAVSTAARPRLIGLYARGEKGRLGELLEKSTMTSGIFYLAIVIPLILNTEYLLGLWLGEVPAETVVMTQVLLFASYLQIVNNNIINVIHASGKIAGLSFGTGAVYMTAPFAVYVASLYGIDAGWSLTVLIPIYASVTTVSFGLARKYLPKDNVRTMLLRVLLPTVAAGVAMLAGLSGLNRLFGGGMLQLIADTAASVVLTGGLFLLMAFMRGWRVLGREKP